MNRSWCNVGSAATAAMAQRHEIVHYFRLHIWNLHHPFVMWANFHADRIKIEKNCLCVLNKKNWAIMSYHTFHKMWRKLVNDWTTKQFNMSTQSLDLFRFSNLITVHFGPLSCCTVIPVSECHYRSVMQ